MKISPSLLRLFCLLALLGSTGALSAAKPLEQLRVLYLGEPGSARAKEFKDYLAPNLAAVTIAHRGQFRLADADGFDVVLLDWNQTGGDLTQLRKHPLGDRAAWRRPTVLLGSAGLLTAVTWQVRGGSGCTCLYPFLYGQKGHEIFRGPVPVPMKKWRQPTPGVWKSEIKEAEIDVIPLVEDYKRDWKAGWCTYSGFFNRHPEIEFLASGINDKTPTAAALWRQGNLFHFGFDQSPAEMNETGQALLLNAIAYISRFADDQPIAVTPSVFVSPEHYRRDQVKARTEGKYGGISGLAPMLSPETFRQVEKATEDEAKAWWQSTGQFLRPNAEGRLEPDLDLVALGEPFDTPAFFTKAIAALKQGGEPAARASRLLARYAPEGPKEGDSAAWQRWHEENTPYLSAMEIGAYRWYVDPLAKQRGIPTADLRGSKRATP